MTRRMPKWAAARGYGDFANDPSLSPFEIALIAAWIDGGAPETVKGAPVTSEPPVTQPAAPYYPPRGVTRTLTCGDQPIRGRLLGVRPLLDTGADAGISVRLPSGAEIVAWLRRYDPNYRETYWLRRPVDLPPGSRLRIETHGTCAVDVVVAR